MTTEITTKEQVDDYVKASAQALLSGCPGVPSKIKRTLIEAMRTVLDASLSGNGTIFATDKKFYISFDYDAEMVETIKACKSITGHGASWHKTHWKLPINEKTFEFVLYFQATHGLTWYSEAIEICKAKFGDDCFEQVVS